MLAPDDAPPGWVPVDRRWFGLDRAALLPAAGVALLALLLAVVVPAIDHAVPGGSRIRAGDEVRLGNQASFVPAVGWVLTDGVRAGDEPRSGYPATASVTDGPVQMKVDLSTFDGSARTLLARIRKSGKQLHPSGGLQVTGPTSTVSTSSGLSGVSARYRGSQVDGLVAVYVRQGAALVVTITGPNQVSTQPTQDVAAMLDSIDLIAKGS